MGQNLRYLSGVAFLEGSLVVHKVRRFWTTVTCKPLKSQLFPFSILFPTPFSKGPKPIENHHPNRPASRPSAKPQALPPCRQVSLLVSGFLETAGRLDRANKRFAAPNNNYRCHIVVVFLKIVVSLGFQKTPVLGGPRSRIQIKIENLGEVKTTFLSSVRKNARASVHTGKTQLRCMTLEHGIWFQHIPHGLQCNTLLLGSSPQLSAHYKYSWPAKGGNFKNNEEHSSFCA